MSDLHGKVSRHIFSPLFPRWPENNIPVDHVTNGVHVPTWSSLSANIIWKEMCNERDEDWILNFKERDIDIIADTKLWRMRNDARRSLITYIRVRFAHQIAAQGGSLEEIENAKNVFDENTLTLGFARRFAAYKRPNLLLQDPQRLIEILTNKKYPVQLILAVKPILRMRLEKN